MPRTDLTNRIERIEKVEHGLGVRLQGLYAEYDQGEDGDITVSVNGEVHSHGGDTIPQDMEIIVSLHDGKERVLSTNTHMILSETFLVLEAFSIQFLDVNLPEKIRVYPKKC